MRSHLSRKEHGEVGPVGIRAKSSLTVVRIVVCWAGVHSYSPMGVTSPVVVLRQEGAFLRVVPAGWRWLGPTGARGRGWRAVLGLAIA